MLHEILQHVGRQKGRERRAEADIPDAEVQKAVCILLTLLHLGIQGIRLGPTLPAFLSPNVLNFLAEHYAIAPTTTPEADLAALLA